MNPIKLYLSLLFIAYSFSTIIRECSYDYNDETGLDIDINPKSADDCKDRLSEKEKQLEYKCCFYYFSNIKNEGYCEDITKEAYDKIKDYIEVWEKTAKLYPEYVGKDVGDLHIDCFSSLLQIGLISFISFILNLI